VTRKVLRPAAMVGAVAFVVVVALAGSAHAAARAGASEAGSAGQTRSAAGKVGLDAEMLTTADLPACFRPYPPLTGPLNAQRARLLPGGSALGDVASLLHGWVRDWICRQAGTEVREMVLDTGTGGHARAAIVGFDSRVSARGLVKRPIAAHLDGYTSAFRLYGIAYIEIYLPLARGPYFFTLTVVAPAKISSPAIGLSAELAAAQSRKVPANTPNTGTSLSGLLPDPYGAAGAAIGGLLGYLGVVNGVAYLQNPLRRERRRERSRVTRRRPDGQHVLDVSSIARKFRNTARLRLAVQIVGLSIAACGADPFLTPYWYFFVLAGAAIVWAGGRFIHPGGLGLAGNRAVLSGARRVRVALMMSLAAVMLILGSLLLITYGLNQSEPPAVVAASAAMGAPLPSQGFNATFEWSGIVIVAVGAVLSRRARRLASVEARRMMMRDPRPPILYLRSFGDDGLKLWTATLGRRSLIERFTPRRFDAFEEVLVRSLSLHGPVIALNPPGTTLAPLGAARETIDSADWHSAIATWMEQSALVVFVAPPRQVTQGLLWEMETVSANRHWDKTLIVVPPVRAPDLQRRWQEFLAACATFGPLTFPPPAEHPHALVLASMNGEWTVITADQRTEWSYSAALRQVLNESLPPSPVGGPRTANVSPTAARRLLTPPMAALVVILVAAAAAGAWYATRPAPAARASANTLATPRRPAASRQPESKVSSSSPARSASEQHAGRAHGLVRLSPAAATYPGARSIQSVISEYFQAINNRDYAEYLATRSPGQALTAQQFETGFRSTTDSKVIVSNIVTAPDGRPEADVTFTSRQQPQDGPNGESCTNWQLKMFFDGNPGGYTMGAPPAGYVASYQPCP
jgi:hypothetical protein